MSDLAAKIRERIDDPLDAILNGGPYLEAVRRVLDVCDDLELSSPSGRYMAGEVRRAIAGALGAR